MQSTPVEQRIEKLLESLQQDIHSLQLSAKGFLTIKNAAQYCDLSEETLRRLCNSNKLTALRPVNGRIVIAREELDAYIRSCDHTPRKGRGHSPSH